MKYDFKGDDTFLARWLNNELSEEELQSFRESEDYERYKEIVEMSSDLETPDWNKEAVMEAVMSQPKHEMKQTEAGKQRSLRPMIWVAAASVVLFFVYQLGFNTQDLLMESSTFAEKKSIELPDGSLAHLNAVSTIEYDVDRFSELRELTLEGEAFFEVKKGSSFTVRTNNGDVGVLGTSFNVYARNTSLNVECYTGKVAVKYSEEKDPIVLEKGDRMKSQSGKLQDQSSSTDTTAEPDWKQGRSRFVNADFSEVMDALERQFEIVITNRSELEEISSYNGGFDHSDLDNALEIIAASVSMEYRLSDNKVEFIRKK